MELFLAYLWIPVLLASLYAVVKLYRGQHHLHTTNLALQQEILSLNTAKESLAKDKTELQSELSGKISEIQKLHNELHQAYNNSSTHEHSHNELQAKLHALESQLISEKEQLDIAAAERNSLTLEIDALHRRLQQQITSGTSVEEQLRSKIDTLELNIADLKKTIESQNFLHAEEEKQNLFLKEQMQILSVQNSDLVNSQQQKDLELQRRIEELRRSAIAELQPTLTELNEQIQQQQILLHEEKNIRASSETALQESKEKLYGVIKKLEHKLENTTRELHAEQNRTTLHSEQNKRISELLNDYENAAQKSAGKIPVAAFIIDSDGSLLFVNELLCAVAGVAAENLRGKFFTEIFPEEDREFYKEQWNDTKTFEEQFHGDAVLCSSNGERIHTYCSVALLPGGRYVGFLLDKRKENEAELHSRIAVEKENELQELKSRFISMVTHQLRASLVTIASNTELLERFIDKWSEERRYQAFYRINDSLKQMKDLLHDVVFTTNARSGSIVCNPLPVNLEKLCQETAKELQNELEISRRFIFAEQGTLDNVRVDENLVRIILRNILSNAFKYSGDDTEIILRAEIKDRQCLLSIEDYGIGIPASEQCYLFGTFFRASNVGNIFGTGLGLTIAKQCVEIHGGTISVESAFNKGTTVTITIPIYYETRT